MLTLKANSGVAEQLQLVCGGYYIGIVLAFISATGVLICSNRRITKDFMGIILLIVFSCIAFIFTIVYCIGSKNPYLFCFNFIFYHMGILTFFIVNFRDPDYQRWVAFDWKGLVLGQVICFGVAILGFMASVATWFYTTASGSNFSDLGIGIFIISGQPETSCYAILFFMHAITLRRRKYPGNPLYSQPILYLLLGFYFSLFMVLEYAIPIITLAMGKSIEDVFLLVMYVISDLIYYITILYFAVSQTNKINIKQLEDKSEKSSDKDPRSKTGLLV